MRDSLQLSLLFFILFLGFTGYSQKDYIKNNFTKAEYDIPMRDGIKLHTTVYTPKDGTKDYPILMKRTPYSSKPYGEANYPKRLGPNPLLMKDGYIFVYQDVRGRWMSEGVYDNMRPYIADKKVDEVDEASDTYDTIEWLINNVDQNNGNVGVWGISYPGFYAAYALLSRHPALKAVSPQAPIGDFYFDDFHHNGAFLLSYWRATSVFGYMKEDPSAKRWYPFPDIGTEDQYQFFLDHTPLSRLDSFYQDENVFWNQIKAHPDYDEFWQKRDLVQHLDDQKFETAVMTVGGLFDAEDLYGPFSIYKNIESTSTKNNVMVFGPWSHGDWARYNQEEQVVGNIYFGKEMAKRFQENFARPFFNYHLKDDQNKADLPEAHVFDTGTKTWDNYKNWPIQNTEKRAFYLGSNQSLTDQPGDDKKTFISDPQKPVPYTEDIKVVFTPRKYMTDDQRFAARRPDVLVFETNVLEEDIKVTGKLLTELQVATTGTAADWIVKVVDVFPPDAKNTDYMQDHLKKSNYHMMVRSEVFRGRYRNSFEKPEPFVPDQKTKVEFPLQAINHTFKKGHKIQIQVQSTFFPYIDLNPQTYVDNIFKAKAEDFKQQTHTVYGDSKIIMPIVKSKK
ncbi:MAG: CocE/NonD family hydrolase [Psychroflexus sp.]|nr:CocE/NonD family hydrolase [Psychroflexus sp.]